MSLYFVYAEYKKDGVLKGADLTVEYDRKMTESAYKELSLGIQREVDADDGAFIIKSFSKL